MPITFTAIYEEAPEGGYTVIVEELPGAISQGETIEEARENIKDAIEMILELRRETIANDIVDPSRVIRETVVIG